MTINDVVYVVDSGKVKEVSGWRKGKREWRRRWKGGKEISHAVSRFLRERESLSCFY